MATPAPKGSILEQLAKGKTFSPNDLFVAVMGLTGSGKSTFIAKCTGEDVVVNHGLESCTNDIGVFTTTYGGHSVHLLDTPGFDDTFRTDSEILRDLATWLLRAFQCKIKLSGIVYLHPITHSRVEGSAFRNLRTFKKMCGTDNLSCVVLATTFWTDVPPEVGDLREDELKKKPQFWGDMRAAGSEVMRHTNDRNSARNILACLLDKRSKIYLAIQEQMGQQNRSLDDTDAGQELGGELVKQKKVWQARLKRAQEDTATALAEKDEVYAQEKLLEQERFATEIKKRELGQKAMTVKMEELLASQEKKFTEEMELIVASRQHAESQVAELSSRLSSQQQMMQMQQQAAWEAQQVAWMAQQQQQQQQQQQAAGMQMSLDGVGSMSSTGTRYEGMAMALGIGAIMTQCSIM